MNLEISKIFRILTISSVMLLSQRIEAIRIYSGDVAIKNEYCGKSLTSKLFKAIDDEDLNAIKELLADQPDSVVPNSINAQTGITVELDDRHGGASVWISPLYFACMKANAEIVEFLLEHGGDPNTDNFFIRDSFLCGNSLFAAIFIEIHFYYWPIKPDYEKIFDVVKVLVKHGADINYCIESVKGDNTTPLCGLIRYVKKSKSILKIIEFLLESGANPNVKVKIDMYYSELSLYELVQKRIENATDPENLELYNQLKELLKRKMS